jgi:hypothetical protein
VAAHGPGRRRDDTRRKDRGSPPDSSHAGSGASFACFQDHGDDALAAGATVDEVVAVLIAVVPTVGLVKVVSAAPALGRAVGYDTDAALERFDLDVR